MTDYAASHPYAAPSPEPRTAPAALRPCVLYAHTASPRPSRTQGHHRHPVYLQNRVYGRIEDPELLWACGLCHDSIHDWISWLLREARVPDPWPSPRARAEAERTVEWYRATLAANAG